MIYIHSYLDAFLVSLHVHCFNFNLSSFVTEDSYFLLIVLVASVWDINSHI